MSDNFDVHKSLNDFDSAGDSLVSRLAAMKPRSNHLDRDRLMFLAGQASASASTPISAHWSRRLIGPAMILSAACAGFAMGNYWPGRATEPQVAGVGPQVIPPAVAKEREPIAVRSEVQPGPREGRSFHTIDLSRVAASRRPATLLALNEQLRNPLIDDGSLPAKSQSEPAPPRSYRELLREWTEESERNRI